MIDTSKSRLDTIDDTFLKQHGVKLTLKRDDLIDSDVSGNKWRKLKYNLEQCRENKNVGVLTFGGAFSNHLVATAAACKMEGIACVGIVRGEELSSDSNETLKRCTDLGMKLKFISRSDYSLKTEKYFLQEMIIEFPNYYIVPEGGANYLGMIGCQEIANEIPNFNRYDRIIVAQGTATTSCGLSLALNEKQKLSVFPAMKGYDSEGEMNKLFKQSALLFEDFTELIEPENRYHFGGYGKASKELIEFINAFYNQHDIKLDLIYNGKAMFGLYDMIKNNEISNENILFIHTGGVQGVIGYEKLKGIKVFC